MLNPAVSDFPEQTSIEIQLSGQLRPRARLAIEALKRAGLPGGLLAAGTLGYRGVTGCNRCVVVKGVICYFGHEKSSFIFAMGGCFSWAIGCANPMALFHV
jgi:hypothetical protein